MCSVSLTLIHQNIRSVRKNFDSFIANFFTFNVVSDIIVLTETHIFDDESNLYYINGFIHLPNCNNTYKCGGVSLFVKSDIKYSFTCKNSLNADISCVNIEFKGKIFFLID